MTMLTKIDGFYEASKKCCHYIENVRPGDMDSIRKLASAIATVYALGLQLPLGGYQTSDDNLDVNVEPPRISFGDDDPYRIMYDPYKDDNWCVGLLSDDLADIYRALEEGNLIYERGYKHDAGFEWAIDFFHWGRHAIGALRPLNEMLMR